MTDDIFVFDRNLIRKKRNRCAPYLDQHNFLIDWSMNQLIDRLRDIKRQFPTTLQIGCRSDIAKSSYDNFGIKNLIRMDLAEKLYPDIQADEELLPLASNSFDLIISSLMLHSTNDLPGTLIQIKNALKPDGLFMATMFGGETLYELREVVQSVELELFGGITPRVAPFADMQQMGSLIQRAGFNLPVIDCEKVTVTYDNPFELFRDLRLMGESNTLITRKKSFTSQKFFNHLAEKYSRFYSEDDGRIYATFDIIFLTAWAPHINQQKPLQPGSAKSRLANALKTQEEKLPC